MPENSKKECHVGFDLSRPEFTDAWYATAAFLIAEPYLEAMAFNFPERDFVVNIVPPKNGIDYYTGHLPYISRFQEHESLTAMQQTTNVAADVLDFIERNQMIQPYRHTPCAGVQNWFNSTTRSHYALILLEEESCPEDIALKVFEDAMGKTTRSNTIETVGTKFDLELLNKIRSADMVVTDNCAIALIASAHSVRHVTCLTMFGDEKFYLKNAPNVRIFKRKPEALDNQYEELLDFAGREWKNYVRYPSFLNEGDAKRFIETKALEWCRGYGIDVGSNKWPFPGAIACDVDNRPFDKGPFDFVFSSHCLEHIKDWAAELTLWRDSLKQDGIMFIYVPHPLMEAWLPEGDWVRGGWHVWSPEPITLARFVKIELGMELIEYTTRPDAAWGFHLIARKK